MAGFGEEGGSGLVQSLARAFTILDVLGAADGPLSLKAVAQAVGLPRSTCHRLLTTMQSLNYVRFEAAAREWHVGRSALSVGAAFVRTRDLASIGRPLIRSLAMELNETINLSHIVEGQLNYVEQVAAKHAMPTFARPGASLPISTTAAGKVILAHMSGARSLALIDGAPLIAKTRNSVTDRSDLIRQLEQARCDGFAVDDQENCQGIRCIAVPVFDETGGPCGALSISGWANRVTEARTRELVQMLSIRATAITTEMGGTSIR